MSALALEAEYGELGLYWSFSVKEPVLMLPKTSSVEI